MSADDAAGREDWLVEVLQDLRRYVPADDAKPIVGVRVTRAKQENQSRDQEHRSELNQRVKTQIVRQLPPDHARCAERSERYQQSTAGSLDDDRGKQSHKADRHW